MEADLAALGFDDARAAEAAETGGDVGLVVRQDRGWVQAIGADGPVAARTRADRIGTPVVGDWITVADDEVLAVLTRRNALRRADPVGEGDQTLAANLESVLVVCGLDRPVKAGRVQRAAVQAWDADAPPTLVLTKADVVDDPGGAARSVAADHPGLEILVVSAHTGEGIDALRDRLGAGLVVLLGESGAGKSSLLNALAGASVAGIGDVRAGDAKGRHTTTRREMHVLPDGGLIVDTPGVRAIGVRADPTAIASVFPDVASAAEGCRFGDCAHEDEPACGVQSAMESGTLDPERVEAFRALRDEAAWADLPDHERRRRPRP